MPDSKKSELFEKQFINLSACHGLQYKAAADTSLRIWLADDEGKIGISGGYLDTVSRTAVNKLGDLDAVFGSDLFLPTMQNFFKEADSFIRNRESYVTSEPLFEVR